MISYSVEFYILFRFTVKRSGIVSLFAFWVFGEDEIKKEGYIMVVIVVVVGGVEIVENSKNVDCIRLFLLFFINIFT